MKSIILSFFLFASLNAHADLGLKGGLDPISLACSNNPIALDRTFSIEIQKEKLQFFPYEGSFELSSFDSKDLGSRHVFAFKNVRVRLDQEGISTAHLASGSILTDGATADVQFDLSRKGQENHYNLTCHKKQIVRVNNPTEDTEEQCLAQKDQACLYIPGINTKYYQLVDSSSVKASELLSKDGCSAEGVSCLLSDGKYYSLEIQHIELMIWE